MKKILILTLLTLFALGAFGATTTVISPKPSVVNSTALEASHVIKATSGTLLLLVGYNSKGSAQFIQIHNAAALPADTAVPMFTFQVAATSSFTFSFSPTGLPMTTGIVVCNSSTAGTKTIGSADVWFMALYY